LLGTARPALDTVEDELERAEAELLLDAADDDDEAALLVADEAADEAEAVELSGPAPMTNDMSKGPSLFLPFWYHGMLNMSGTQLQDEGERRESARSSRRRESASSARREEGSSDAPSVPAVLLDARVRRDEGVDDERARLVLEADAAGRLGARLPPAQLGLEVGRARQAVGGARRARVLVEAPVVRAAKARRGGEGK